jgi:hypothetical protein
MVFAGLNAVGILVAAIVAFAFGSLYYGLLGKRWLAALGKTREEMKRPDGKMSPWPFIAAFIAELIMAWVLAGVLGHLGPGQVTIRNGIISALFIWVGFVATTTAVNNGFAGRKTSLSLIDCGHWLGVLVVEGAVIGLIGT